MVPSDSLARVTCALQLLKPASRSAVMRVAPPVPWGIRINSERPLKLIERLPDPAISPVRSALPPRVEYDWLLKTRPASLTYMFKVWLPATWRHASSPTGRCSRVSVQVMLMDLPYKSFGGAAYEGNGENTPNKTTTDSRSIIIQLPLSSPDDSTTEQQRLLRDPLG